MKKQFDWDKFKREKIAVHCKTEEEAKDFCREMHEQGMKWNNGDTYLKHTCYRHYKEKTCYAACGCYCDYDFFIRQRHTILEWSDYMQKKEFTKADLKDGMVVEGQRGIIGFVLIDKILYENGWNSLALWKEDLTCNHDDDFDIIKVYKIKTEYVFELSDILNIENLELIWERDETKHMTAEEMRKKLEELTGDKIEVEPSREEMLGVCYKFCKNYTDSLFCKGCPLCEIDDCEFVSLSDEELKQCYEKVIANGK